MSKDRREVISAKVSPESLQGWRTFCYDNGISMAALLEVAGLQLAMETNPPTLEARVEMVRMAREIDIQRRARK